MFSRYSSFSLLACFIFCCTGIHAQSLLTNGGFEQGLTNYQASGGASIPDLDTNPANAQQGSNSVVFGTDGNSRGLQQIISLVAGQQYTLSFYFKPPASTNDRYQVYANIVQQSFYPAGSFNAYQANNDPMDMGLYTSDSRAVSTTEYNLRTITGSVDTSGDYIIYFFGSIFHLDSLRVNAGPVPTGAITKRKLLDLEARKQEILNSRPHCPQGSRSCHISSSLASGYECIDEDELTSCGGCVSEGSGQDCTLIPNAAGVGCQNNKCIVFSCASGFALANNLCAPSARH